MNTQSRTLECACEYEATLRLYVQILLGGYLFL